MNDVLSNQEVYGIASISVDEILCECPFYHFSFYFGFIRNDRFTIVVHVEIQ